MLLVSATVAAGLLVAIAVQRVGASLTVLVPLAAGIGLATPPVGACLRSQFPGLLSEPSVIRAAYALEASVVELTYIFGPPLALGIGALWSTGSALAAGGIGCWSPPWHSPRNRPHATGGRRRRRGARARARCTRR